jgi:hypothetical protein
VGTCLSDGSLSDTVHLRILSYLNVKFPSASSVTSLESATQVKSAHGRGSRAYAFGPCVPVTFTIAWRNDKKHAEDVAPIFPMSEPEDLAAYRETSEISKKTYDYAFLKRPCGDELFVHLGDVIQQYKDCWNLLEIGSPVYHGARFDEETQRWRADYVELYSFDELQSFKVESEPESTLVEPVPEVLSPANKSKTFLQLALERKLCHELQEKAETKP